MNKLSELNRHDERVIKQYDALFEHINNLYSTTFFFDREQYSSEFGNSRVYHSKCVYNSDPINDKQVTAFVSEDTGFVTLNCYHDKCQHYSKYSEIACVINKHVFAFWDTYTSHIFTKKVRDIDELFDFN